MRREILLGLVFATSLFAKTELSLNIGTNSFDSSENLKSSTTFGIRGDFYLDNIYHMDFGYDDLGDVYYKNSSLLSPVRIKRFYTQFSADGEEEYHVVPTVSVGAGYEKQKGYLNDSEPFISLGVGFRYNVSNSFNFLLGTKALWKTSSRDINYHTTFGMGYLIDEAPANNQKESVEEVIIPEKKLEIPKVVVPEQKIFHPEPIDVKTQSVQIESSAEIPEVVDSKLQVKPTKIKAPVLEKAPKIVASKTKKVIKPSSGVYIQVGAFSKYKPTRVLDRLVKSGEHIILRHQGKITKALVGPYSSKGMALKALSKVRKIAPRAFIYKGN
jgi:cell division septation protein DedD